ncbi:uncharacterized protein MONOS_12116 [Monocercomonoides exilis]|uniref:uncharacterized protein n=1 Tax=Monocercomonoides exilis TaxID=2049356 RepID=UPI0035598033|nr:hypothetical protein MONOS_12116 [Monocercomonoides exilis]|eukprot:MONOS_12116.1-p1 / transcript=MONOS_12116.1 / gene=MONOS_12116 / organism=Monocercomonoides_exilis_PA203 / gene_product=unspecified product / transcript_product=unspecified product / location=Mono_scaffold00647:30422-32306(-) / protein_length=442 / sequence_SO=supercontig / SO=protein_coding / is_pseudo=false
MTGFTKSEFDLLVRLVQPEIYHHLGKRRVIEKIRGMEEVALVLDCTVLLVNKTGKEFNCGSDCFSGKHKIYCVKVEVGVNPKTGTASTVSKVHGGAVHYYVVFREHYSQFAARLDGGKIMTDSAYIGAKSEFRAIITKPVGTLELAAHRVIVERFFGLEAKRQKKELANEKYRARLLNRLNPSSTPTSSVTSLHALEDTDATTEPQTQIKEKKGKCSGDQKVVTTMNEDTRISSISESDEAFSSLSSSSSVGIPTKQNLLSTSTEVTSSATEQSIIVSSPQPQSSIIVSNITIPTSSSSFQFSTEPNMREETISDSSSLLSSSQPFLITFSAMSASQEIAPISNSSLSTQEKQKSSESPRIANSSSKKQPNVKNKISYHHFLNKTPSISSTQAEKQQILDKDCLCIIQRSTKFAKNLKEIGTAQRRHNETTLEFLLNSNNSR